MSKLTVTRGLPGSGKSTWAREQQANNPKLWRVNRDDLRAMLRPTWIYGNADAEGWCTAAQYGAIRDLLDANADVVVDDTNLMPEVVDMYRKLAKAYGAEFEVKDFTEVPLEDCIERDAARPEPVGEEVIRRMHDKYLAGAK